MQEALGLYLAYFGNLLFKVCSGPTNGLLILFGVGYANIMTQNTNLAYQRKPNLKLSQIYNPKCHREQSWPASIALHFGTVHKI